MPDGEASTLKELWRRCGHELLRVLNLADKRKLSLYVGDLSDQDVLASWTAQVADHCSHGLLDDAYATNELKVPEGKLTKQMKIENLMRLIFDAL